MNSESEEKLMSIKKDLLKMFYHSRTGHMASSFSCVDILFSIYEHKSKEDEVVLSKGHGGAALYAVLAHEGIIEKDKLMSFYDVGSDLLALASNTIDGISIPTGSLGQGICYSTGVAKANVLDGKEGKVFCVLGDGEMQEGSVWEAATFAGVHKLKNLVVILDHNHIQAGHKIKYVSDDTNVCEKWAAFNWNIYMVNGHDVDAILDVFKKAEKSDNDLPHMIIAETKKGNGIYGIEDRDDCHMKNPKGSEWDEVCKAFGISLEELVGT